MSEQAEQSMADTPQADIALPEPRANRPVTLSSRVEFWLTKTLFGFFRLIGIEASSNLAGGFTRLIGPLLRPLSRRAEDNLALAFPEWTDAQIKGATRDVWENLARTTAEFAHLKKISIHGDTPRIQVHGKEAADAFFARNQPVIFVSGHFGNWEVMSIALHEYEIDYGLVYRAANNPLIDEMIINLRAEVMSRRQIPKGKRGGRQLIETISSGVSLAMLVDQKLNDGVKANFFGHPAMTAPAAARLALKYNAPIIPTSVVRRPGSRFDVYVRAPLEFVPSGNSNQDVADLTQLINDAVEREVRLNPGQWLWLHRRWMSPGQGDRSND